MHRAKELLQKFLLLEKAEIENDGSVRDYNHFPPSDPRVLRS